MSEEDDDEVCERLLDGVLGGYGMGASGEGGPARPESRGGGKGPLWVTRAGGDGGGGVKLANVLVECFGERGEKAAQFAALVSDPLDRCQRLHGYVLTKNSIRRSGLTIPSVITGLKLHTSDGAIPHDVEQTLLKELTEPQGISIVVGEKSYAESASLDELTQLYDADEMKAEGTEGGIEWHPADFKAGAAPPEPSVAFWQDVDSWAVAKMDEVEPLPAPEGGGGGGGGPENMLDLDSASESEFSWESGEGDGPGQPSGGAAGAELLVALAACVAVLRGVSGCYRFGVATAGVAAARNAARRLGLRCWQEWDLAELALPGDRYGGPAPRFVPRTPRWTLQAVRSHQETALNAAFPGAAGSHRFKSGVVALPCGAGKTMVGVLASAAIRAPALVLCTSGIAVEQWVAQYGRWVDVHTVDGRIARFTGKVKDKVTDSTQVVVTTYNMLMPRKRSAEGETAVQQLLKKHWGIVVLDEVHVLPAESCSTIIKGLHARSFLGLTATLVREDNKIDTLDHLIGPRLHEAEWADLVLAGVLARVKCIEVRCVMTPEFMSEYLKTPSPRLKSFLACLNPSKIQAAERIVAHHERRGDKTLVFCDSIFVLRQLQVLLNRPAISGSTQLKERLQLLSDFQSGQRVNTLIISRVGDCAIDLPAASVIIQVSSHFGSRRQEAQRLGRILRSKGSLIDVVDFVPNRDPGAAQQPNALFYSMVSQDTMEVSFSRRRQAFLEEQGYAYQQVWYRAHLEQLTPGGPAGGRTDGLLGSAHSRVNLLARALSSWQVNKGRDDEAERRVVQAELQPEYTIDRSPSPERIVPQRRVTSLANFSSFSGANALVYAEWDLASPNSPQAASPTNEEPAAKRKKRAPGTPPPSTAKREK
ncbi:DNA excision repair protein haywire [Diplonema papillatum]|nr:DNA excision repair protein haywire [Diplonema papillatum]